MKNIRDSFVDPTLKPPATTEDIEKIIEYSGGYLPEAYLDLLKNNNGLTGTNKYGYIMFYSSDQVVEMNKNYEAKESIPGFLIIGSDGGMEAVGIDVRSDSQTKGQFFEVPFIPLDWEKAVSLGSTLEDVIANI